MVIFVLQSKIFIVFTSTMLIVFLAGMNILCTCRDLHVVVVVVLKGLKLSILMLG